MSDHVLDVIDLHASFSTEAGIVRAVDGVSFYVDEGETLAIVGESGCGKTATALSILGLLPPRIGQITSGEVLFQGRDLVAMKKKELRSIRGDEIGVVFQDALTALNPVKRVGEQVAEVIRTHRSVSKKEAADRAVDLLDLVGIPNASARARDYVFQFSGGQRQRAMIALAIALEPKLLIADEPTTALDVTVQAQIMETLLDLKERLGMSMILITHDLGVVAGTADRVMVMYAGRPVERQPVDDLYENPKHPYSWGLMQSTPAVDETVARLYQIPGAPPSLVHPPKGCRFAARCVYAQDICRDEDPPLKDVDQTAAVACHFSHLPDWGPSFSPDDLSELVAEGVS
ncbi:MAG: ABC transporter ATP-binding protein [Acidimicrobiales bacterium]